MRSQTKSLNKKFDEYGNYGENNPPVGDKK
jgi:hypothetical protein